jgi:uncharacterized protein YegJ (DUF2314 family)
MFAWLSSKVPVYASAFFPGTWPIRKDSFDHLTQRGIELSEGPSADNAHWSLHLCHPVWGEADLIALRNFPMPPHTLIECDSHLIPDEVEEIKSCGSGVSLYVQSSKGHILRDRKNALCFLNAILGDDGVAVLDHVGQKFWSRTALQLETAHPADLDVEGIFTYHATSREGVESVEWLHTHGLGEIGFFDFDVLRPDGDLLGIGQDLLRCIAFGILEGRLQTGGTYEPIRGKPTIRAVKVPEFMAKGSAGDRALRADVPEDHTEKRVVLCDGPSSFVGKLFGGKPAPSRLLSDPFDPRVLIQFSDEATAQMSERAKATFLLFTEVAEELREFECSAMVKLSYQIDSGEAGQNEHLWFEYHGLKEGQIDGTLGNAPFRIARMKEGQRDVHSVDRLTDWGIFTPGGLISPRSTKPLRFIRQHKDELRVAFEEDKKHSASG